jgi:hypothetical protein
MDADLKGGNLRGARRSPNFFKTWMILVLLATLPYSVAATVAHAMAKGQVDRATDGQISGWALDLTAPSSSINVAIYADGPVGVGNLAGFFATAVPRTDVNTHFGVSGEHGSPGQFRHRIRRRYISGSFME